MFREGSEEGPGYSRIGSSEETSGMGEDGHGRCVGRRSGQKKKKYHK